jgi:hypothetical protein
VQDAPRNPYSPPTAPTERPDPKIPVPNIVKLAATLFGASHVLFYLLEPTYETTVTVEGADLNAVDPGAAIEPDPWLDIILTGLAMLLYFAPLLLLYKAAFGRSSWARLGLTAMALFLLFITLEDAQTMTATSPVRGFVWLISAALEIVALAMFYTPAANRWYRV